MSAGSRRRFRGRQLRCQSRALRHYRPKRYEPEPKSEQPACRADGTSAYAVALMARWRFQTRGSSWFGKSRTEALTPRRRHLERKMITSAPLTAWEGPAQE